MTIVGKENAPSPINASLFDNYYSLSGPTDDAPVEFGLFGWQFSLNTSSTLGFILLLLTAAVGGALLNFTVTLVLTPFCEGPGDASRDMVDQVREPEILESR